METITVKNFPDEFSAIYEAKGVWNEVKKTREWMRTPQNGCVKMNSDVAVS